MRSSRSDSKHPSLQPHPVDDGHRQFLDREHRGVHEGDALGLEHALDPVHLEVALSQGGVVAVGAAFAADLVQTFGLNAESATLVPRLLS